MYMVGGYSQGGGGGKCPLAPLNKDPAIVYYIYMYASQAKICPCTQHNSLSRANNLRIIDLPYLNFSDSIVSWFLLTENQLTMVCW